MAPDGAEDGAVSGQGLSADDETTLYGPLPSDFWGDDSGPAPSPQRPEGTEAKPGGTAFAELQELFPGRILEIIKEPNVSELQEEMGNGGSDVDQGPGVDDSEGYDDPDQSRLSFGPDD